MPRHAILTHGELETLLAFPSDKAELIRHYTLSEDDLILIRQHRGGHNRLGFAIQLCYMRYPGFSLPAGDAPPQTLLDYVCTQLQVSPDYWPQYAARDETRREHLLELQAVYGFKPFNRAQYRKSVHVLADLAWQTDKGILLAEALIQQLRQQQILLPASNVIERACTEAVMHGNRRIYQLLTANLTDNQRNQLDALLEPHEETRISVLSWLRQPPAAAKARNVLKHIERLRKVREIGLSDGLDRQIHQNRLLKLAREGGQMTAQHLRELEPSRRYATIVAVILETRATLIDEIVDLHDRILGFKFTTAKHKHAETFHHSGKAINDKLRIFCKVGQALLAAKASGGDPFAAIEGVISWEEFSANVEDAAKLAQPPEFDFLGLLDDSYPEIRRYAPALLESLQIKAAPAAQDLLQGVDTLKTIYEKQLRKVPDGAPTAFINKRWEGQVIKEDGLDRRFYELCILSDLKDGLRSGDIWVQGSRQFKDFEEYLLPLERFNALRTQDALPMAIETDCDKYLNGQFDLLKQQLQTVEKLASAGQLPDARFSDKGRLIITPLKKDVPTPVKTLQRLVYPMLPHVKITELLLEVNAWTGFAQRFTHVKSGAPAQDMHLLLTAILAGAINQGLSKMAECCPGTSYAKLAWIHAWHIRDETYSAALSDLTNAQQRQPLAAYWGDGTTSSSDGQWFRTGGRGTASGYLNAKYGTGAGVTFYSHISDQLARYHIRAIHSQVRDSTYVLDGLLYHESDLRIEEHYTDTAGFTDHVFAMMPMLGFRFAPHIRDLKDKKLYIVGDSKAYPTLANIIGGQILVKHIRAQWDEVLRLVSSIAEGTVTASLMLKKLGSYPRQNTLALALREIGRIERTLFTLAWLQSVELRRRVRVGLNKGEACNSLADAVSFNRRGELHDRSFANQQYRASGLNLVVAAIVLWNTVYLERAINVLRAQGHKIDDELVKHLSPLIWAHINLSGDYIWGQASTLAHGEFRPLNTGRG